MPGCAGSTRRRRPRASGSPGGSGGRGALGAPEADGGPQVAAVAEGLGEVAERPAGARLDRFGGEAAAVGAGDGAVEAPPRAGEVAEEREVLDEPERAGDERALAADRAVHLVAPEEALGGAEAGLNRTDRGGHARVGGG